MYVFATAAVVFLSVSYLGDVADWWWQVGAVLLVVAGVAFVIANRRVAARVTFRG